MKCNVRTPFFYISTQLERRLLKILLCLLLLSAHLHRLLPIAYSITLGSFVLFQILRGSWAHWRILWNRNTFLTPLLLYIILYSSSCILSDNQSRVGHSLAIQLPLFIFPFVYVSANIGEDIQRYIRGIFIIIVTGVSFVELGHSSYLYFFREAGRNVFFTDQLTSLTKTHSTYFSMYLFVAFWWVVYFIKEKRDKSIGRLVIYLCLLLYYVLLSYLIGSKIIMAFLGISLLITFFYVKSSVPIVWFRYWVGSVVFALLLCVSVFHENLNRYRGITNFMPKNYSDTRPELDQREAMDTTRWTTISYRVALWKSAWQVWKEHKVWGVGVGDVMDSLLRMYKKEHFIRAVQDNSKPHNTFLDVGLDTGLVGVVLFFLSIFYYPIRQNIARREWVNVGLLVALFLSFQFESYTARVHYLMLLAFMFSFLATRPRNQFSFEQLNSH